MACRYIFKGKEYPEANEFRDALLADPSLAAEYVGAKAVPSAPFVTRTEDWTNLALKRVLRMAAEEGYDRVAWTRGEQQVERYNESLRKAVDRVEWTKTAQGVQLVGFKDGRKVVDTLEKENAVSDAIGKSMADAIKASPDQTGQFSGEGLRISDTGMAGYYDKIVPDALNKLGKKWGAKVGETRIQVSTPREPYTVSEPDGWYVEGIGEPGPRMGLGPFASEAEAEAAATRARATFQPTPVPSIEITPEMRRSVVEEGQPLFKPGAPAPGTPAPAVDLATLRQRFKGARNITPEGDGGYRIAFRDGLGDLVVRNVSGIEYAPLEKAFKEARPEGLTPGMQIAGASQRLGQDVLVRLVDGVADPSTLGHEELHGLLMAGRVRPGEIDALWREHGYDPTKYKTDADRRSAFIQTEEKVADTVGKLIAERLEAERAGRTVEQPSWFARLWAYLKQLAEAFRGYTSDTAATAKERIASGGVYEPVGVGERVAAAAGRAVRPIPPGTVPPPTRFATAPAAPGEQPKSESPRDRRATQIREAMGGGGGATEGKPPELPFNLDRLNIPADEKAAFSRAVEAQRGRVDEAQGRKTFEDILADAKRELGIKTDAELQRAMKDGMLGDASTGVAARIRLQELRQEAEKASALAKDAQGTGKAEAEEKAQAAALKYANFMLAAKGAQSETARALAAYRILAEPRSEAEIAISRLLRQRGGLSGEETSRIIRAATEAPETLGDTVQKILQPKLKDQALELWKAGLLSGVPTHGANFIGNLIKQGMTLAETAFTAHVTEPALAKAQGRGVERFPGEAGASWAAVRAKAPEAFGKLVGDLRDAFTLAPEDFKATEGGKLEYQVGAIPGKAGRGVRIPFRLLQASDDFFKTLAGEQELYKQALRKANRMPRPAGEDVTDTAQRLIDQYNGLTPEQQKAQFADIYDAVQNARLVETFQNRGDERRFLDATTNALTQVKGKIPALNLIFPFTKTPGRIASATLERTPWGFLYALKHARADYNAGKISAGEYADALTKPVFGTIMGATFAAAAKAGLMTGSGPTDQKEQNALRQAGWQPYSFVFDQPDGSKTYVPFNRFEPVSSILGMAADLAETGDQKKAGDLLQKIGGSIVENLTNKTYLAGLEGAANALSDPQQYAAQFLKSTAGTVVPNIVAKAAQATDTTIRDTRGDTTGLAGVPQAIARTIQSRIPGLSEKLPPRYSGTGEPAQRQGSAAARFLSPSVPSTELPGALERELVDIDAVPTAPGRDVTVPGTGGRKVRLSDDEYQALVDARSRAAGRVERTLKSPGFRAMDPERQRAYVRKVFDDATNEARQRLMPRLRRRVTQPGVAP